MHTEAYFSPRNELSGRVQPVRPARSEKACCSLISDVLVHRRPRPFRRPEDPQVDVKKLIIRKRIHDRTGTLRIPRPYSRGTEEERKIASGALITLLPQKEGHYRWRLLESRSSFSRRLFLIPGVPPRVCTVAPLVLPSLSPAYGYAYRAGKGKAQRETGARARIAATSAKSTRLITATPRCCAHVYAMIPGCPYTRKDPHFHRVFTRRGGCWSR